MAIKDDLTDGVVRLRPLAESDLAVHAAGCDDEIVRWSGGGVVSSDAEHLAWLRRNAAAWAHGADVVDLGVERVDSGELAGVVGIQWGMSYLQPGQVNLTYAIYPRHRGLGLATRATRLAGEVAASRWPVTELVIRCDRRNTASAAVAIRLGFIALGEVVEAEGPLDWYVGALG